MTARRAFIVAVSALCVWAAPAGAQGYRVRVAAGLQDLTFRGLTLDSVLAADVRRNAAGGLETADGHAVRCSAAQYCHFFRTGPALHASPLSLSASGVVWGIAAPGISLHTSVRLLADLRDDKVWPGTKPAVQLLEAYGEYERAPFTARLGRQLLSSRLEAVGFDGGWARARWDRHAIDVTAYGGWGLAQSVALSASNAALNPLDEWRPRDRQLVGGAEAGWAHRLVDLRAEYRREVDPEDDHFVSERAALSFISSRGDLRASGGVDYNIAEGNFGTSDLALSYVRARTSASLGARRYRPYFSLWTLWGAFSPVPYNAVHASGEYRIGERALVRARGERFWYDDADVSTALVPALEDRGWRLSSGVTYTHNTAWSGELNLGADRGPGAAGNYVDASIRYAPSERLSLSVYGGWLARPLELRYYDADSKWIGARADWQVDRQLSGTRVWIDAMLADDDRERPDAGRSSLRQTRVRLGAAITLGSADRVPLPPAKPVSR